MSTIQRDVERDVAAAVPGVEVLLAEVVGAGKLRVFIDHADGVTLDLCERVSLALAPYREQYALEVSSPGDRRPLTKPDHFRRFIGRRARVRTRSELRRPDGTAARTVTGELVGASESELTVAASGALLSIPYGEIERSNLVGE
jgi:ribosome maturation factor RimP